MSRLPETQTAESEIPIKGSSTSAVPTAVAEPGREFQFLAHFSDRCNSCHKFSLGCRGASRLGGYFFCRLALIRFEWNTKEGQ
jgi:hypothetical protein